MILKEKFLIIGSNSFSGASFINYLLEEKYEVLGVSRSNELNYAFLPYKWHNKFDSKTASEINNFNFKRFDINKNIDELMEYIIKFKPTYIVNFASPRRF